MLVTRNNNNNNDNNYNNNYELQAKTVQGLYNIPLLNTRETM